MGKGRYLTKEEKDQLTNWCIRAKVAGFPLPSAVDGGTIDTAIDRGNWTPQDEFQRWFARQEKALDDHISRKAQ